MLSELVSARGRMFRYSCNFGKYENIYVRSARNIGVRDRRKFGTDYCSQNRLAVSLLSLVQLILNISRVFITRFCK